MIQRLRSDDGVAAVEFALVLPLLSALVFGVIEFGLMFNAQLTLQHAAREGVRVFSITKDATQATTATTGATSGANLSPVTVATYDGATASATCTHGVQAKVTVDYTYSYLTPMFATLFGSSTRDLSATGVMRCGG